MTGLGQLWTTGEGPKMVRARTLEPFLSSYHLYCGSFLPTPVGLSARIGVTSFKVERGLLTHFVFVLANNRTGERQESQFLF